MLGDDLDAEKWSTLFQLSSYKAYTILWEEDK